MKTRKTLLLVLSLVLVAVVSVAGTLAYLKSEVKTITNTFTVGKVDIKLEELKLNEDDPTKVTTAYTTENQEYKVYPGQVLKSGEDLDKDGIVTILKDSEPCYVFVKVETVGPLSVVINTTKWALVEEGVYVYGNGEAPSHSTVVTETDGVALERIITSVTVAETVEKPADLEDAKIVLTAYAIQSDGLTVAEAWAAVSGN